MSAHAQAVATLPLTRRTGAPDVPVTDEELVQRAKDGHVESFSELVRRHQTVVYNLSYRFMRDSSLAEDMSQEAFLKGFRLLKGFRGDCRFSTWMYRVTCSVCLTELNRRRRRGEVALTEEEGAHLTAAPVRPRDSGEIIRLCVQKLPERYAAIMTMYYLKEISYEEIAAVMQIPMGTLKTWMHRARKQLRTIVEQELGGDAQNAL
jgi:RNA polymerase sigma-70 factor (ECF subfamily)